MVCYVVPLATGIITSVLWSKRKGGPAGWWLNLLLYGGAMFGFVDHLWAGQLFLLGNASALDLVLGGAITATIVGGWGLLLSVARVRPDLGRRMGLLVQN